MRECFNFGRPVSRGSASRGIKISILYADYHAVTADAWYNSHIKPFQAEIGPALQACASPGLFYDAGLDAADLGADLVKLFNAASEPGFLTE